MTPPTVDRALTEEFRTSDQTNDGLYGSWPWRHQSDELSEWVFEHCVNRKECFGRYGYNLQGRHETDYAAFGLDVPVISWTEHDQLTKAIIRRHFEATTARNLIGLHATSADDTCKWICIDIDQHGAGVSELAERNYVAAMRWYSRLSELGFQPLLWHSNGLGGFRLTALFEAEIPASIAYSFGHWLIRDWKEFALSDEPEVFPKQPSIKTTEKGLGNFLRLPGRHHKRNFYAQVYTGDGWVDGEKAIDFMLLLKGQSPSCIPAIARSFEVKARAPQRRSKSSTCCLLPSLESSTPLLTRARAILDKWRPASSGDRNNALFRAGMMIGERLPIAEADHVDALLHFNARFAEPLAEAEVRKTARSAFTRTQTKRNGIEYASCAIEGLDGDGESKEITLDRYRDLLQSEYESLVGKPGVYLDRTPVGGGKTYQGQKIAGQCSSSLHIIPTHRNKEEVAAGLITVGGIAVEHVASYPERNEETCRLMDEVDDAYRLGISVTAALCATCKFRKQCDHVRLKDHAEGSLHSVSTMARMKQRQLARAANGRELVRVDENCIDLLRPCDTVRLPELGLALLAVRTAHSFATQNSDPDIRATEDFLKGVLTSGKQLTIALEHFDSDRCLIPESCVEKPKLADFVLMKGLRQSGIDKNTTVIADAMHLLIGFACGELSKCCLQVSRGKSGNMERTLVGVWETQLPRDENGQLTSAIVLADATANSEILSQLIDEPVIDITPQGSVRHQKRVMQIPRDIKRGTTVDVFLKEVRGILIANPNKARVGLIGHSNHVRSLSKLGTTLGRKIIKSSYFGSGDDRASNEWKELGLDLLLVVGTPRIGPSDVRTRMIQLGLDDEAPASSEWISRWWRGKTESGDYLEVRTSKYADPIWQTVYELDVRATLIQSLGRARAILSDGMDALVVTCEPLGLSLCDDPVVSVNSTLSQALDVVCEGNLEGAPLRQLLMERLGVSRRTAFSLIGELQDIGVLIKLKRGRYQLHDTWSHDCGPP